MQGKRPSARYIPGVILNFILVIVMLTRAILLRHIPVLGLVVCIAAGLMCIGFLFVLLGYLLARKSEQSQ